MVYWVPTLIPQGFSSSDPFNVSDNGSTEAGTSAAAENAGSFPFLPTPSDGAEDINKGNNKNDNKKKRKFWQFDDDVEDEQNKEQDKEGPEDDELDAEIVETSTAFPDVKILNNTAYHAAPKRRRVDDIGHPTDHVSYHPTGDEQQDTRCRRCKLYGQRCLHGSITGDHTHPTSCVGCASVKAECIFEHDNANPAVHGGRPVFYNAEKTYEGFLNDRNREMFDDFLHRFISIGIRDNQWRLEALDCFDGIKSQAGSLVGAVYFGRDGELNAEIYEDDE